MPMQFARADIEALAALAQLELEDREIDLFAQQLSGILEYATQVQQIDTTGVPPTASVGIEQNTDRQDEVRESLSKEDALGNAPDGNPEAGLFKVPRVIG